MKNVTVINEEVPFGIHELFVSMTDKRGIILAGNTLFVRVSGHARDRLIGSPHNIIRHPDMPKCIFKLFWETLAKNEPICAYVKNRSNDGRYYWVLAVAVPTEKGYLSIRLKPISSILDSVKSLYQEALREESRHGIEKGTEALFKGLQALGYSDYNTFMSSALFTEIQSRDEKIVAEGRNDRGAILNQPSRFELAVEAITTSSRRSSSELIAAYANVNTLPDLSVSLLAPINKIVQACRRLETLSMNMNVSANKLGKDGASLAIVAQAFQRSSNEITERFGRLTKLTSDAGTDLKHTRIGLAICRLQSEMLSFYANEFHQENSDAAGKMEKERRDRFVEEFGLLSTAVKESFGMVINTQKTTLETLKQLRDLSNALRSVVLGLDLIRLGGRLEGSRTSQSDQIFKPYTEEMITFIETVESPIQEIASMTGGFISGFEDVRLQLQAVSLGLAEIDMMGTRIPKNLPESVEPPPEKNAIAC